MKEAKEQKTTPADLKGYIEEKKKELADLEKAVEQQRANLNATAGAIQGLKKVIDELKGIAE